MEGLSFDGACTWSAGTFCSDARRRLRQKEPCLQSVQQYNMLLLGPAGVGKSSLVHTCWRAVNNKPSDATLLERLRLGWSTNGWSTNDDKATSAVRSGGLRARHGTTALASYALQTKGKEAKCGIFAQDTKGQQFFDEAEANFATKAVEGHLRQGSTQERESLHYWTLVAKIGLGRFVKRAELTTSPHAVVLVFDATLRS